MSRPAILALTALLPMMISEVLSAQQGPLEWSSPIQVAQHDHTLFRPRITLNGDLMPVILWGSTTPAANHVAVLENEVFSAPQIIHPPGVQIAAADWQGSDLVSMGDAVHAVVKRIPESTGGIYLVSSADGGYTWGDTLRVDQIPGYKSRFSSIALNGNGQPLVQYMRIDMQETDHRFMVSRLTDGSFDAPVDVSSPFTDGEDCDCCPGQIVAQGDAAVALFRDATNNVRVIWGAASVDGGGTFQQGAELDPTNWSLFACPASGPDGVISGDSIRYTWMSGAINGSKVHIGSASVNDLQTGAYTMVHPGQAQNVQQHHPRIAGSGDTLGVVWQQTVGLQTEILFSWSVSGVHGFSVPDTVNVDLPGAQRTPDIAFANGTFHITWAEPNQQKIMYRRATLSPFIGIMESDRIPMLTVWPVPAVDVLYLPASIEKHAGGWIELHDGRGALIASRPLTRTIDIADHSAGIYTMMIRDRHGVAVATARYSVSW